MHNEHMCGQVALTTGYNQHLSSNNVCEQNGESSFGQITSKHRKLFNENSNIYTISKND